MSEKVLSAKELNFLRKKLEKGEPYENGEQPMMWLDAMDLPEIEARHDATFAKQMLIKYGYEEYTNGNLKDKIAEIIIMQNQGTTFGEIIQLLIDEYDFTREDAENSCLTFMKNHPQEFDIHP